LNIILIEDDQAVRQSLGMLLRLKGYVVDDYGDGASALHTSTHDPHACLIIDYLLPDTNGLALLEQLRSAGQRGPAILITGYFDQTLERRATAAGFLKIFEKPFHYPALLNKVDRLATQ